MDTTIDTYVLIKKLKEAGMPEPQAVVMSDVVKQVEASRSDVLATKADLISLESRLSDRMTRIEGEMKLIRWMLGVVLAGVVSIVFKLFFAP
jgi:hypothetical protein